MQAMSLHTTTIFSGASALPGLPYPLDHSPCAHSIMQHAQIAQAEVHLISSLRSCISCFINLTKTAGSTSSFTVTCSPILQRSLPYKKSTTLMLSCTGLGNTLQDFTHVITMPHRGRFLTNSENLTLCSDHGCMVSASWEHRKENRFGPLISRRTYATYCVADQRHALGESAG